MKKTIAVAMAVLLLLPAFAVRADELPETPAEPTATVIVKLTDISPDTIAQVESVPGVTVTDILSDATVIVEATSSASETVDVLQDLPSVSYAEPSYARTAFALNTSDTLRDRLWGLDNTGQSVNNTLGTAGDDIDASRAWTLSYGTSSIVAVIDSGVLYTHPDLAGSMWDGSACVSDQGAPLGSCIHGYDFADEDLDPAPVYGTLSYAHGTHVAGIIAAQGNNGIGVVGVAPAAKVMALRFGFDTATEVRAIDFARQNGAKVINASFGGTQYSQAEYDAIKRFTDAGGIFVAASGNAGSDDDATPTYPAAYDLPGIISVAATDQNDALASFSNYGSSSVDIGAPGVNIASTYVTGTSTAAYMYLGGTSMAAPHVAGVVALIESLYPMLSSTAVKDDILSGGDTDAALIGKTVSGKRLNAYTALLLAGGADLTAPSITLNGPSSLRLTVGDTYVEQGAIAFDAHDGTTTVSVGGDTVNTALVGVYHVTYDSVDAASNHATQAVRTVTVQDAAVAPVGNSSGGGGGGSPSHSGGGGGGSSKKKSTPKVSKTSVARPALATTASSKTISMNATASKPAVSNTPAPAQSVTLFTRTLTLGMSGTDVTALQSTLTRFGLYTGPISGYFGPLTQTGVRAYQIKHGFSPVGIVGPQTRAALNLGS